MCCNVSELWQYRKTREPVQAHGHDSSSSSTMLTQQVSGSTLYQHSIIIHSPAYTELTLRYQPKMVLRVANVTTVCLICLYMQKLTIELLHTL